MRPALAGTGWAHAAIAAMLLVLGATRAGAAASASDARSAAERYCASVLARSWARPGVDAFVATRADSSRGFWFVHVAQRWRELAVEPVDVCVTLDANGAVRHAAGAFALRPEPAGAWTLSNMEAEARGRRAAHLQSASIASPERVLMLSGGALRPAYRVRSAPTLGTEPTELFVDAERGDVLLARGGAWHAVGNVYPTDGRDPLSEVTLTGLAPGDSVLTGRLVRAEDGTSRQLHSATGDFRLSPSAPDTTQFDEVNVWVYVQQYLAWLQSRGYRGFVDTLHVRTHAAITPSVAYTNGNYVLLADSVTNFAHDAAKARDIVTHEVQHFVSEGYGLLHGSREGDALQEGLSDYMAAAVTGDPRIGEWAYVLYPNGVTTVANDPAVFNYANFDHASWGGVEPGSTWANGMIFSGALWDLRAQLGATADSLVLEALSRVPSSPTFGEFDDAMVHADGDLHGGAYGATVIATFLARGIEPTVRLTVGGPNQLYRGQPGTFTVTASEPVDLSGFTWTIIRPSVPAPGDTLRGVATGPRCTWSDTVPFLATVAMPAGSRIHSVIDPALVAMRKLVPQVTGPPRLGQGEPGTFRVGQDTTLASVAPTWDVRPGCTVIAPCPAFTTLAAGWSVVRGDTAAFDLRVTTLSRWGESVSESLAVANVPTRLKPVIPPVLTPGVAGHFLLQANDTLVGDEAKWFVRRYSVTGVPGPFAALAIGWTASYGDTTDFDVLVTAPNIWGYVVRDTQFVSVRRPTVAIEGPSYGDGVSYLTFSAAPVGMGPWTYRWLMFDPPGQYSSYANLGAQALITVRHGGTFDLSLGVTDAMGRSAFALQRVYLPGIAIHGAATVAAGTPSRFIAAMDTTFSEMTATWTVARLCGSTLCSSWSPLGTGWQIDYAPPYDSDLMVTVTTPGGFTRRAMFAVANTAPLIKVVPDDTAGVSAHRFTARPSGASPFTVSWYGRVDPRPFVLVPLGTGPELALDWAPPYTVIGVVTDANGRTARDSLVVRSDSVAVVQGAGLRPIRVDDDRANLQLWAPAGARTRLAVYDLGGRMRDVWFDGEWPGGERTLVEGLHALEPGIYFCRWRVEGAATVRRFVVVR